jgi:hypothetical protein
MNLDEHRSGDHGYHPPKATKNTCLLIDKSWHQAASEAGKGAGQLEYAKTRVDLLAFIHSLDYQTLNGHWYFSLINLLTSFQAWLAACRGFSKRSKREPMQGLCVVSVAS